MLIASRLARLVALELILSHRIPSQRISARSISSRLTSSQLVVQVPTVSGLQKELQAERERTRRSQESVPK